MLRRCIARLRAPRAVQCPYEVLGLPKGAGVDAAKDRFKKLALRHHPDMPGGDDEKFLEVQQAFEMIKNGGVDPATLQRRSYEPAQQHTGWGTKRASDKVDMNDLPEATYLYRNMVVWTDEVGQEARAHLPFPLAAGMVLYATPRAGPKFKGSVAVIAEVHPKGGTIAYVVNLARPGVDGTGFYGGPCGHRRHEVLVHRRDDLAKREDYTTRTAAGFHFDCEVTPAKAALAPKGFLLNGFCGWRPGTLERMVKRGAWRIVAASPDWLHTTARDEMHNAALRKPIVKV
eukprot:TRINITY_DN10663_c0_g1_i1.p1 TRINITY_DN10663_c0_g1~~TRINITY_DN10663_c0_g1_i1.p1  ORF type:complete len:287 (+),score=79.44 TRINITY_DN10663_c0_g1_i1:194-1054(+)